jgi:hypothetical protein
LLAFAPTGEADPDEWEKIDSVKLGEGDGEETLETYGRAGDE